MLTESHELRTRIARSRLTLSRLPAVRLLGTPQGRRVVIPTIAVIVLVFRLAQFAHWTGDVEWGYDFSAYWAAASRLLHGEPLYSAAQLSGQYSPQQQWLYL